MLAWPVWMDEAGLMAKSAEQGGETLSEHTWQVLSRLSDQVRLRPDLPDRYGERLWDWLYWGCFLHDFGKAAEGFQAILQKQEHSWRERRHRHEVLSLGFVNWLFPKGHPDRLWVIGVIATHHKDSEDIFFKYGGQIDYGRLHDDARQDIGDVLEDLTSQIDRETCQHLWRWASECGRAWADELQILLGDVPELISLEDALQTDLKASIFKALRDLHRWRQDMSSSSKVAALLSRGLILTSDHSASAGMGEFPSPPSAEDIAMAAERSLAGHEKRSHQRSASRVGAGSTIMVAPTGSGKTEAAMVWAARQMQLRYAPRIFYTLPYQASMNAMAERLCRRFFDVGSLTDQRNQIITIQHSRALLKFYQEMMDWDEKNVDGKQATRAAKRFQNLARLNYFPIQVFSPYQMLKAAYSLKGFEALLLDYTDALFIFDEIHAYDPGRLALIVSLMGWLAQHCNARFLVMAATLPPLIQEVLEEALPNPTIIRASAKDFQAAQRHEVMLHDGNLLDQLDLALADYENGQAVLVCCNQIATAQEAYRHLKDQVENIVLLHGRFNGKDRNRHEQRILDAVQVRGEYRQRPFLAVTTQVVEVSLDVDFDTLYTDPAPLEALLQRFGRVNRGRQTRGLLPVHVFREPSNPNDTDKPHLPYDEAILNSSVMVLGDSIRQDARIDESKVTQMLGKIYTDDIGTQWQQEFDQKKERFERDILGEMVPYQSADTAMWHAFYEMFDGVQVLPHDCYDDYIAVKDKEGYLAASQYLVNISWAKYNQFKNAITLKDQEAGEFVDYINRPYSPEFGLDLDRDEDE